MLKHKPLAPEVDRIVAPLKAAVWFAIVGFVVLAVETPHLSMSPDRQNEAASMQNPALATPVTDYFPAQFQAPKGEHESVASTF